MNKVRLLLITALALLSFGVSLLAQPPQRSVAQFDVARNIPVLIMSSQRIPKIAEHIRQAQASGQPSILTRVKDKSRINSNRRAACGKFVKPSGQQCDEYPFASTYEGGANASKRAVPAKEQQIQEGIISAFYRKNNIEDGVQFRVRVE